MSGVGAFQSATPFKAPDGWVPPEEKPRSETQPDMNGGEDDGEGGPGGVVELRDSDPLDLRLSRLPRNDWGNAQRLLARFGQGLMFVVNAGWYAWDGTRWRGEHGMYDARQRAHDAALAIAREAEALRAYFRFLDGVLYLEEAQRLGLVPAGWRPQSNNPQGDILAIVAKEVNGLLKWSVNSGNAARTTSMLAQAEPALKRDIQELDAKPYLLNFPNGTLELYPRAGDAPSRVQFRAHDPQDLLTRCMGAPWDENLLIDICDGGAGSEWERALSEILPDDDQRRYARRWFGYCTGGPPHEQAMLIMAGGGSNGKSVVIECVEAATGDYAMRLPVESLKSDDSRRGSDARPDLAELPGRRMVVASEPEGGMKLDTGQLKQLTERTVLRVRQLHQHFISFVPQHRLTLQCNEKPIVKGADGGTWRRLKVLEFKEKWVHAHELNLPENKHARLRDDTMVPRIIKGELSVVAAWLVAGWLDYAMEGLNEPDSVRAETAEYRSASDPVGNFIKACIMQAPGRTITGAEMYSTYKAWCTYNGHEPWSGTALGRRLATSLKKKTSGNVLYLDVAWTPGGFAWSEGQS